VATKRVTDESREIENKAKKREKKAGEKNRLIQQK
jgi:hypothetical protein